MIPPAERMRGRSLGNRLVMGTLGFCLVFTIVAASVRTWSAWRDSLSGMRSDLELIERMYKGALSKANWDLDREQVRTYAEILSQAPSVGQVRISVRLPVGPPLVYERTRKGWEPSSVAPVHTAPLTYQPFPGRSEVVGELTLSGDETMLWTKLRSELLGIVVAQLVQSLLLATLVMLLFNRLVTVHVRRIARHLAQLTPLTLKRVLILDRPAHREDELALLVTGVNQLQDNLSDYLERQQRFEQELEAHRDRLTQLVQARTAELELANRQLEALSRTDALTGLANRRMFDEAKQVEFQRARRNRLPLVLVLCDIDHFKRFNDTYGHGEGDACLRAVAGVLRGTVQRSGDLVARIGGEEFAILLPGSDREAGMAVAARLHRAMETLAIGHAGSDTASYVTLSMGVAGFDPHRDTAFEELFHRADRALYDAKRGGRNRVASEPPPRSGADGTRPLPFPTEE